MLFEYRDKNVVAGGNKAPEKEHGDDKCEGFLHGLGNG